MVSPGNDEPIFGISLSLLSECRRLRVQTSQSHIRPFLSIHRAILESVLLILNRNNILKLLVHLWNLPFLLNHVNMSGSFNRWIFWGIYLSVLPHSVAVSALSSVLVIYLDEVAALLLLKVLLEILLSNFSLNIRSSLRGWFRAIDFVLRATVCPVGANASSIWSTGSKWAFYSTFTARFVDGGPSPCAILLVSFILGHFWILSWVLIFALSHITRWRVGLWHDFELHLALNDIWGLNLVPTRLSSLIQSGVRLLWRTDDAFRIVFVLLVVGLVCSLDLILVPYKHWLSEMMLFGLVYFILMVCVVVAALRIYVIEILLRHQNAILSVIWFHQRNVSLGLPDLLLAHLLLSHSVGQPVLSDFRSINRWVVTCIVLSNLGSLWKVLGCFAHANLILELLILLVLHHTLLITWISWRLRVNACRCLIFRLLVLLTLNITLASLNRWVFGANSCGFRNRTYFSHLNYRCLNAWLLLILSVWIVISLVGGEMFTRAHMRGSVRGRVLLLPILSRLLSSTNRRVLTLLRRVMNRRAYLRGTAYTLRMWTTHSHHLLLVNWAQVRCQIVSSIHAILWLLKHFPSRKEHRVQVVQMHLLQLWVVLWSIVSLVCVLSVDIQFHRIVSLWCISDGRASVLHTHKWSKRSQRAHRTNHRLIVNSLVLMILHHLVSVFSPCLARSDSTYIFGYRHI